MTLKMDSRDDRIGRSVSLGEMLGHPGVMPPTDASQRGWIREEIFRFCLFNDLPFIHKHDAISHLTGKIHFMGNDEHRHAIFGKT